ncbi:MAG: histidine kinase [Cyclobacteriaceae bacterium]
MPKLELEKLLFQTPRILWHFVFWLVYVSFFSLVYGFFEDDYGRQFFIQLTDAVVQAPAVYFTIYFLMPRFLFKEKYVEFILSIVFVILAFSTLIWIDYIFIQQPLFWPESDYQPVLFNIGKILKNTTKIYPVLVLAIVIKWFKYWYKEQKANQQLASEKLQAELRFLKAQVHPHFLFNTLNNLYALTLKQSKEAPEVVLKLSDLLNYMLYECNADTVPLNKEIKLVKDYISLEKIRYGKRLNISFNVRGEVESKMVAPMLILPFVENCFKHGVSEELDESWVNIDLEMKGKTLTLKVENSKSKNGTSEDRFEYKEGIGLNNVKRRLELLYGERHELDLHDDDDSFLVILKIEI